MKFRQVQQSNGRTWSSYCSPTRCWDTKCYVTCSTDEIGPYLKRVEKQTHPGYHMTDHGTSHLPLGQQPGPSMSQVSQAYLQVLSMDQPTTPWTCQRKLVNRERQSFFQRNLMQDLVFTLLFVGVVLFFLLFTILVNGCEDYRPSQSFEASLPDLLG